MNEQYYCDYTIQYNGIRFNYIMFYPKPIYIWRPPSLSELISIIFNMELTHLDLEASINSVLTLKRRQCINIITCTIYCGAVV